MDMPINLLDVGADLIKEQIVLVLVDLRSHFSTSDLDELSSPSISPPPVQLMPSRLLQLKITLELPTQTQKPAHVRCIVHKDKVLNSNIESEDDNDDDEPHGGDGKRPLTMHQAVLVSVIGSLHVSLGASLHSQDTAHLGF